MVASKTMRNPRNAQATKASSQKCPNKLKSEATIDSLSLDPPCKCSTDQDLSPLFAGCCKSKFYRAMSPKQKNETFKGAIDLPMSL